MKPLLFATALLMAASAGPLDGQTMQDLRPDALVRLTRPDSAGVERRSVLRVDRSEGDTLFLYREVGRHRVTEPVSLTDPVRLELHAGRKRHTLLGLGAGAFIGALWAARIQDEGLDLVLYERAAVFTISSLAGFAVGFFTRTDTWREVEPDPRQGSTVTRSDAPSRTP